MLFSIEDYVAGILIGVATTLAVRAVICPGMDMVIAMLIGMGIGTVVHLFVGLVLAPLVGMFETMGAGIADRDVRRHALWHARFDGGRLSHFDISRHSWRDIRRNRRAWREGL
jgi:hypothetical protein